MRLWAAAWACLALAVVATALEEAGASPSANATAAKRPTPWIETLSWSPRAFLYHNFLTPEECDHIIAVATPGMARSSVINADGSVGDDPIRTSYGTFIARNHDEVITAIEERVATWAHLPAGYAEDMQVLRYQNMQKYGAHWDELDPSTDTRNVGGMPKGTHRVATVLIYLSDVEEGGETAFPHSRWLEGRDTAADEGKFSDCAKGGVAALARKGNAILFWGMRPDSVHMDYASMHTGCPVIKGTKWSATKWLHAAPFRAMEPEEILAKAQRDGAPCVDARKNCKELAADGACAADAAMMRTECAKACGFCCLAGDVLCERQLKRKSQA